ncbi:MAG: RNA polymerase sigma factor [Henriciella sp.]|nr:RNA polymerase sigma factor [Hyphomonadaceae bacterium]
MFSQELERLIPELRAYARMLSADRDRADDIVQNACLKAWKARRTFDPKKGSFKAWMFVITRNEFLQDVRKSRRTDTYCPSAFEATLTEECQLASRAECSEAIRQLFALNQDQRDVFILVIAVGYSYEEAAKILNCSVGTVKSRINRARAKLIEKLSQDNVRDPSGSAPGIEDGFHQVQDVFGYADQIVRRAA